MSVDPTQIVTFDKSIILSYREGSEQSQSGTIGQLRFNQTTLKFEGYHSNAGSLLGEIWRPLTQDIASASNLGVIKVGTNLTINPTTGVLSSVATGVSRFYQLVITISPILGAADYQTINTAISNAIGTPGGGYMDGVLTSNIGSPPSPTYPFVIQLGPGQYSEPLNEIILPDYVSIFGEANHNSVITLNAGNNTVSTSSMINVGQNAIIRDLVININDTATSNIANALYINNTSNVIIDNCIFNTSANCNTTQNIYCIYMTNNTYTYNNKITNCAFNINSPLITSNVLAIYIANTIPTIQNNKININTNQSIYSTAIALVDCNGVSTISDIPILDNLIINNNYENTVAGGTNYGVHLNNSTALITNSQIECNNDATLTDNYGIIIESLSKLATITCVNKLSFTHYTTTGTLDRILSNDISTVNFNIIGFMRGQYITVSGSTSNDGVYKIANIPSNDVLELDYQYKVINEAASAVNIITITALYNLDIQNSTITGSTNALKNKNKGTNANYMVSLSNNITNSNGNSANGGEIDISPCRIIYTNYKTLTVGKENCNYTSLSAALYGINDNSASNQYLIRIENGIYQETEYITCKEYVNIEGNGINNTVLQFYQVGITTIGTPTSNSSCLLLDSHTRISDLKIVNSSTDNTSNATSTVLYNSNPALIEQVTLDNVSIESVCGSVYNYSIYLSNASNISLNNVSILTQSNDNSTTTPLINVGLYANSSGDIVCNNVNITTNSSVCVDNIAVSFQDTNATLNNISCIVNSGSNNNIGIKTENTTTTENLIELFNGQIKAETNVEYSLFADNYYTIVCNGVNLIGDTYTSPIDSRIICNGCYTFTSSQYNTAYQSLNSRGQNEQAQGTITIGDSAGKLSASGINNLIVGVNAGSNVTTASNSVLLGTNAGSNITTASDNVVIGASAGSLLNDRYNTFIGSNVGMKLVNGISNTFIGYNTGSNIKVNSYANTIIGSESGINLGDNSQYNTLVGVGCYNIYSNVGIANTTLGYSAGGFSTNGNSNVLLGGAAGLFCNGDSNVLIGVDTGLNNQASNITAVGTSSGYKNVNGTNNTFLGFQTGYNNTTGNANTFIGNNAGYGSNSSSITGSYNTVIGNESGYSLTTGSRNVFLGSTSSNNGVSNDAPGWAITDGNDNILIGVQAGSSATSAINNVIIGSNVGSSITTGGNNVLIGKDTGTSLQNAGQSVIIGSGAGVNNTVGNAVMVGYNAGIKNTANNAFAIGYASGYYVSGDFNMFMGYSAGGQPNVDTTGAFNIAIGPYSGYNLTSGTRNVILGSGDSSESAGRQMTTGSDNTLFGYKSGKAIQTGSGNTLVGSNAGANLTSGINNLLLGYKSGFNLNNGSYNVVLGPESGYNLNAGSYNISSGYQSSYHNQSGNYNINIGYKSGFTSTDRSNNIHIGYEAGYDSIADNNIFIGASSGVQNTTGENNIFMGQHAGYGINPSNQQIGDNNIFMGTYAGNANHNGYRNIFMGYQSGKASIGGSKNVFIGENTGSTGTTSHNIFIGSASDDDKGVGYLADTSGQYNVFVGHDVGIANTTGRSNIFLGDGAGFANVEGLENIYIGTNAGHNSNISTANYNIAIGSDAGVKNESGRQNILIGKQVAGLTTSTDYNQNIIIGSEAGQNIQQDNQIFIGTYAGKNNTTGDRNIFIGLNAGTTNINSQDNVIIGSNAGVSLIGTTGLGDNVIIGSQAGHDLTTGINNIFIGSNSGANAIFAQNCVVIGANCMSTGDSSNVVIIGNNAGQNNNADSIIAIGFESGNKNTNGTNNIFMGTRSGFSNTTGLDNIMIGLNSGYTNTTGNLNIFMGAYAGNNNTTGIRNIMIGINTGAVNNIQSDNVYIGAFSGQLSNGYTNMFFGTYAGINNIGSNNIALGINAGYNNNGFDNIIIGGNAGYENLGSNNILLGRQAGYNNNSSDNIFVGVETGYNNTIGTNNIFMGKQAGFNNVSGQKNIFIGESAGYNNTNDENISIGYNALKNGSNPFRNISIGANSCINMNGSDNIFIGNESGKNIINGQYNIGIGYQTNGNSTTSLSINQNILIGYKAGYVNEGANNIYIGAQSGYNNISGVGNTYIGVGAGFSATSGTNNTFVGVNAGNQNNGSNNILFGYQTGLNSNADNLIFLGSSSGYLNTSGKNNTFIGYKTGFYNTIGDNNTYIGNLVGQLNRGTNNFFLGYELVQAPTIFETPTVFSNKFAIYQNSDRGITSNSSGTCNILIGGDFSTGTVGIGTLAPDSFSSGGMTSYTNTKLVVLGKVLANSFTSFTGAHMITLSNNVDVSKLLEGMIMSSNGRVEYRDINNTIVTVEPSITSNDKKVFGIYCGSETVTVVESTGIPSNINVTTNNNSNINNINNIFESTDNLEQIQRPSNINVITSNVITSNVTTINYYANSLGEGGILVSNWAGEIQNGDYITSCPIPGYGCLQADDILHSYTVAKCTQNIDWSLISENILCPVDGKLYKSFMASCTYHCG